MSAVTFTFPMPPNLTNRRSGGSHWRTLHKEKTAYLYECDQRQAAGLIPPPPERPWKKVAVRSVMWLGAFMDDDNALARHKHTLDWLKTRGYLADDRRQNIEWITLPEQIVKRDGNYRIELTLVPINDDGFPIASR